MVIIIVRARGSEITKRMKKAIFEEKKERCGLVAHERLTEPRASME